MRMKKKGVEGVCLIKLVLGLLKFRRDIITVAIYFPVTIRIVVWNGSTLL